MTDEDLTASRIARAEALTDLGRYEQAIELLTTIPQTSPDVAVSVNCLLAFAHVKLNNLGESHACAGRAVEAMPDNTEALYWLTATEPDAALALEHASRLVALAPEWAPYRALNARTLKRNSRSEEAESEAREAVRLAPEEILALNTLGDILLRSHPDEALDAYQRVLDIDPGNTSAREGIAKLKRADDADESSRLYRGLLETNPERSHYESQLHWMVFVNPLRLTIGTSIVTAAGWLVAAVPYALGWRTAALACATAWSVLVVLGARGGFKENAAKIADGLETSPREVIAAAFRRRPIGSSLATVSLVAIVATPAVWGAWGLLAPASSWWTAVGVPILIMLCGWIGAFIAWITATRLGR